MMSSITDDREVDSFIEWKIKRKELKLRKRANNKALSSKKNNNTNRKWVQEVDEIKELQQKYSTFDNTKVSSFEDIPLSSKTLSGLQKCGYKEPTSIQKAAIFPGLQGKDILGAAKTGSGKTIAFLIPVLELLFRERWSSIAGPGALIISPTRELAYQIFEVLKKIGSSHDFSAGLIIGGKDVKTEAMHMSRTNILVCTPGRLLQHMDETNYFEMNDLQILVLDEADRILDMGFKSTINAIVENLPKNRQTLLFSATQTKSVKDLARLSLQNPAYVSVHESSKHSTPSGLNQKYIVCKLEDKLNLAFSFIKNHLKTKTLIFLSSCKQVQYIFASFCKMQPGVPLMMLHGNMKQHKRMEVYDIFCRKKFVILFCTDVAARGLDFPGVDWVFQLDCPEDAETYIHRAGRTARYHGDGHALLTLLPSEESEILEQLKKKKVPLAKTEISTKRFLNITPDLQSLCAENVELKEMAQRCFVSYVRAVHHMKNKSIFNVDVLELPEFSKSLGLMNTPHVKFKRGNKQKLAVATTHKKFTEKKVMDSSIKKQESPVGESITNDNKDATLDAFNVDEDGQLFSIKRDVGRSDDEEEIDIYAPQSKKKKSLSTHIARAKNILKKGYKVNQKITYDEEGSVAEAWPPLPSTVLKQLEAEPEIVSDDSEEARIDINEVKQQMKVEDVKDKEKYRARIKEKHKAERRKERENRKRLQAIREGRRYQAMEREERVAFLASDSEKEDEVSSESDHENEVNNPSTLENYFDNEEIGIAEQEKLALHFLNS